MPERKGSKEDGRTCDSDFSFFALVVYRDQQRMNTSLLQGNNEASPIMNRIMMFDHAFACWCSCGVGFLVLTTGSLGHGSERDRAPRERFCLLII